MKRKGPDAAEADRAIQRGKGARHTHKRNELDGPRRHGVIDPFK